MIEGAIYGYTNKGNTAFGVLLKGDTNEIRHEHGRVIKLKSGSVNTAELHALEYTLAAINDHNDNIKLSTCNAYVPRSIEKLGDDYKMKPEKNVELINRVRKLAATFKNVVVNIEKSELLIELQKRVKTITNQANT